MNGEDALHPTQADFLRSVKDNDKYIIDYRFDGNVLIVHTSGHKSPPGTKRIHQSDFFEYQKTKPLGKNEYGQDEFYLYFGVKKQAFETPDSAEEEEDPFDYDHGF